MAAESSAGATPSVPRDWHSIDWKKAHGNVRRLQARIVQAMKAGKWGKVKALQHLLTRSFSAKALAVKRVTENQGKNTPGVDTVIWKSRNPLSGSADGGEQGNHCAILTAGSWSRYPSALWCLVPVWKSGSGRLRPRRW